MYLVHARVVATLHCSSVYDNEAHNNLSSCMGVARCIIAYPPAYFIHGRVFPGAREQCYASAP